MSRKHRKKVEKVCCVWCNNDVPIYHAEKIWEGYVCKQCYSAYLQKEEDRLERGRSVTAQKKVSPSEVKVCSHCDESKSVESFGRRKNGSIQMWCKECHRKYNRKYRSQDGMKAKNAAYMREYRARKKSEKQTSS